MTPYMIYTDNETARQLQSDFSEFCTSEMPNVLFTALKDTADITISKDTFNATTYYISDKTGTAVTRGTTRLLRIVSLLAKERYDIKTLLENHSSDELGVSELFKKAFTMSKALWLIEETPYGKDTFGVLRRLGKILTDAGYDWDALHPSIPGEYNTVTIVDGYIRIQAADGTFINFLGTTPSAEHLFKFVEVLSSDTAPKDTYKLHISGDTARAILNDTLISELACPIEVEVVQNKYTADLAVSSVPGYGGTTTYEIEDSGERITTKTAVEMLFTVSTLIRNEWSIEQFLKKGTANGSDHI